MSSTDPASLLAEVLARYEQSPNPRLREVTVAAIRHLHAFALEVGLQRDEWFAGIQFLTATGKISDDVRQEFILLSDSLGVSSLVEVAARNRLLQVRGHHSAREFQERLDRALADARERRWRNDVE